MRFNDLTQTILAVEERTGLAATTLWRQCVDMLAQYDQAGKVLLPQEDRVALVARLNDLRAELNETQRIASVVELGSRLRSPALVEFFASDRPSVCAAAMARAQLPDAVWPVLLPRLGPTARGILRGRRDIGKRTRLALEAFGSTDLVLGTTPSVSNDLGETVVTDVAGAAEAGPLALVADQPQPDHSHGPDHLHGPDHPHGEAEAAAELLLEDEPAADEDVPVSVGLDERSQIRMLVERIERFTSAAREQGRVPFSGDAVSGDAAPLEAPLPMAETLDHFPFETDTEGALIWVGEASRTALVGLSIAQPASPGDTGPDGHVAGAFARRSSFQHGRLFIGEGLYEGEWRLSAVPFFDPATGRFQGYRGQARRPLVHEMPHQMDAATQEAPRQPSLDSMRQVIHELRTPLNAILGFAEIIEQQLFGPAGVHYREMAGNILSDARRLMAAFDDIDLAARSAAALEEEPASRPSADAVDMEALMNRVAMLYNEQRGGQGSGPQVRISASANIPPALIEPVQGERMVQHLVRTLVSVAGEGEVLQGAVWFQPEGHNGKLVIGFDRPSRLTGLDEHDILDPGYGSDGDWPDGPLLGLGFSVRLVRSLAQGQGGALRIEKERILLELPVADRAIDNAAG
ncbi:MAG: sensor histidine kinase [Sphingobium sp.]